MKVLSEPSSGKRGNIVAFISRYGQCQRQLVTPKNTWSPAREHMRGSFGRLSRAWSGLLTEAQRQAWCDAGPKVQSAKRLTKSGPLTGQQHFQGINSARARLGLDMLLLPPAPVVFGPNPVGNLVITNDDSGVRLFLNSSGPVTEDIMVFGQAPCSSGRRKRRNVSYLGLITASQAGLAEITALYVARFGEPATGQRIFIVTRQQKDGWEGFDHETHEIVPDKPADQQAAATESLPFPVAMHKGCTRDAQGVSALPAQDLDRNAKPVVLSQNPPRAPILGLLLSLCLWLDVSAQEAPPGFVSRLAAVVPMPALAQVAKANYIPLEQIDPSIETNRISPGDSFTAVVALFSKRPETQWLLFLQGVEPTPKELKENSPGSMVIYNTLGHKLEFPSAPAFVALRTIGPFIEGAAGKKPRDETTRFVLDQGFLGLGLEQAAAAMHRMHRSGAKGPFMSGTEPFGDDVIGKCRKADESWHINPAEERALAGSFPALLSYFKTAQEAPELLDILAKTLDRPSIWSLLWHGGISSTEFRWDATRIAPADASAWQVSGHPAAYYCPMTLLLNHHPSLDLTLVVTAPQPPLLSCGGVLGLLAEKPGDKQIYLTLRIVSARLSAKR